MLGIMSPLSHAAKHFGGAPALLSKDKSVDYRTLETIVSAAAGKLIERGIKKGDRVAIAAHSTIDDIVLILSLWRAGVSICPINPRCSTESMISLASAAHCGYFISSDEINAKIKSLDRKDLIDWKAEPGENIASLINLSQIAAIVPTSGSLGRAKLAVLTHGNFYYSALGSAENIPFKTGDCWLVSLPLYHVSGLSVLYRALVAGAAIGIPTDEPDDIASAVASLPITHLSLVNAQALRLFQDRNFLKKAGALKAVLIGGEPVSFAVRAEATKHRVPCYFTYGLTETASQVATTSKNPPLSEKPLAARPLPFREVKISSEGEIFVKGETLFAGYMTRGQCDLPVDHDGWFATGDLGYLNQKGGLVVTGRKDNMFVSGGENIHPEAIERAILESPEVARAVIVPIAHNIYGARPAAFIEKREGSFAMSKLIADLNKTLPGYMIPDYFFMWPEDQTHQQVKLTRPELTQKASRYIRENKEEFIIWRKG